MDHPWWLNDICAAHLVGWCTEGLCMQNITAENRFKICCILSNRLPQNILHDNIGKQAWQQTIHTCILYITHWPILTNYRPRDQRKSSEFGPPRGGGGQSWNLSDVLHQQDSQLPETSTWQFWQKLRMENLFVIYFDQILSFWLKLLCENLEQH